MSRATDHGRDLGSKLAVIVFVIGTKIECSSLNAPRINNVEKFSPHCGQN